MKKTASLIVILFHSYLQSQTFDGNLGSQSLKWTTEQKDFNSAPRFGIAPMSIKLWDNYEGANAPSQWGTLLEINGKESHLDSQLYFTGSWDNGRILYRSAFYGQTAWQDWRYVLDSKNDVESSGNLKINGTGNSGIGTSNPEKKLQIDAPNSDAGLRIHAVAGNNNTNTPYLLLTGGYLPNNGVALQGISDQNYGRKALVFYSGWEGDIDNPQISALKERMRISSNGNVGIGINTPSNKLDVNGTIHSKEVKVDMTGWSDFVFKKEYNLPTLEEVEKHITEKGHLENIPNEEEVLKSGINLGEMNAKLLQKIEELTLYVIEQNKKIEKQNERIMILENK
ncbi:hypothetical protein [Flavobacterium sp. C3NV]|jgi:hypothetical protein|uniref:hypothetical protein n=1 Tax=Flavobacterium sp. C3NV TaxID=3393358 RepID=UPI00398FF846